MAAERGYLREAGNLLFHLSVLVVLVGFAIGQLYGYKGGVITVVGQGFSNTLSQYDDFAPGSLFDPDDLPPAQLHRRRLPRVLPDQRRRELGQPQSFSADLSYRSEPGAPDRSRRSSRSTTRSTLDGVNVFLVGHGYAPVVTVKDGNGDVAYQGPVVFLPQDSTFASYGVIKVPDAAPEQLGFEGLFFPTYGFSMERGPFSQFPDALNPVLSLIAYHGDLGLDDGKAQSVYALDKTDLKPLQVKDPREARPVARVKLEQGQTVQLADGPARSGSTASGAGSSSRSATRPARASRSAACCSASSA